MVGIGNWDIRSTGEPKEEGITLSDLHVSGFDRHSFSLGVCSDLGFTSYGDSNRVNVGQSEVFSKKSGPTRLSKGLMIRMPSPLAYQVNKATMAPGHKLQKGIGVNCSIVATAAYMRFCCLISPISWSGVDQSPLALYGVFDG